MSWRRWTTSPVSGSTKVVTIDQTPGLGSGGEGVEVVVPVSRRQGRVGKKAPKRGGERRKTGEGRRSAVQWRGRSTARKDAAGFVGDHTKNKGARYVNGLRGFPYFLLLGLLSPPLTLDPSFLAPASFCAKTPDPHRMANNDCPALVASPNPKGVAQLKIPHCNDSG